MNYRLLPTLALAGAALALAACSSGNNGLPSSPTPGPTCQPPSGTQVALVYPAPNATAVPDTFGQVVLGSSTALPSSWSVVLETANSAVPGTKVQAAPSPLPTPNATPSFPNPVYQSSYFPGFTFQGEVVQVFLNDNSSNCTPKGPIAQFTTQ